MSEKTVYNYFPTKESLLFDREEESTEAFRAALGPNGPDVSPVEAAVRVLASELDQVVAHLDTSRGRDLHALLEFNDLIERTPALRAYRSDMIERSAHVAAEAMALRAGVNPEDPEPQIAGDALVGLWRVFYRSLVQHSRGSLTPGELREEVMSDVRRAARLIDTGLWSFSTVVQGAHGREQFRAAADASNEARKQVLAAVQQARDAWRTIKDDLETRVREETAMAERSRSVRETARPPESRAGSEAATSSDPPGKAGNETGDERGHQTGTPNRAPRELVP